MEDAQKTKSLNKSLDILEEVCSNPSGIALSALSANLNINKSTACRILGSLTDRGYISKDTDGVYYPTLKLFYLSEQLLSSLDYVKIAKPFMQELSNQTGENINLLAPTDSEVVNVHVIHSTKSVRTFEVIGEHHPFYCNAAGKAILSTKSPDVIESIWNSFSLTKHTVNTITDYDVLMAHMHEIRRQGFSIDREEHMLGIRCIGAPIFNYTGKAIAGISISAPSSRMGAAEIAEYSKLLRTACQNISYQLGCVETDFYHLD